MDRALGSWVTGAFGTSAIFINSKIFRVLPKHLYIVFSKTYFGGVRVPAEGAHLGRGTQAK